MQSIIRLEDVTKEFPGGLVAVDNVSLDVKKGEFITLLGPSGCGKSTILRMVAGFESPNTGHIFLDGTDVTERPPYRRNVNMVFQDYALFPHMNVRQNVGYGLRVSGVDKGDIDLRVNQALDLVELSAKADNTPAQLSGGQRQRVSLARALVREPKVLLLDEPLSALDANLREAMQIELRNLHQRLGITFVMVTHDQTEALAMADRIVVMESGRIAQCGTPLELYDQPATPYVAKFIGSSTFLPGTIEQVNGQGYMVRVGGTSILTGSSAMGLQVGDSLSLCIRPEKIHINESGSVISNDGGVNNLEGRVVNVVYHGSSVRMDVDLGVDQLLMVDVPLHTSSRKDLLPSEEAHVSLAINREDILLFPQDRSA